MNLVAYDKVCDKLDRTKTWIDIRRPVLISNELPTNRPYYTFVKRFEPEVRETHYFLVLLDNWSNNPPTYNVHLDDYGRVKISLAKLASAEHIDLPYGHNVKLIHTEHTDDGDIYRLML